MCFEKFIVVLSYTFLLWNSPANCQEEKTLYPGSSDRFVNCLDFSDGGSVLAFGDGQNVGILRPGNNSAPKISASGHRGRILSVDISPDSSMIASGGSDNLIIIHDPDGSIFKILDYNTDKVTAVRFSPTGRLIYSGSADGKLICFSITGNRIIFEKEYSKSDILSIDVTVDGKMLAAGGADHNLILLDALTGDPLIKPVKLGNWIRCVKFNKNVSQLAACSDGGRIHFWNISETGSLIPIGKVRLSFNWVTSMDYFPDNISFAYASDNGKVGIIISRKEYVYRLKTPVRMIQIRPPSKDFFTVAIATSGKGIILANSTLLMKRTVQNAHLLH